MLTARLHLRTPGVLLRGSDRHFDSFYLRYVRGFLDDAAGGGGGVCGGLVALGQVSQGHGSVELVPVGGAFTSYASFRVAPDGRGVVRG